jgi:hypothetical protein
MKKSLLIIAVIFVFSSISFAEDNDFRNVKWGMSQDEVIKVENAKKYPVWHRDGLTLLSYTLKMFNTDTVLQYAFTKDDKLVYACYIYTGGKKSGGSFKDQDSITQCKTLVDALTQKYGNPQSLTIEKKNKTDNFAYNNNLRDVKNQINAVDNWVFKTDRTVIMAMNADPKSGVAVAQVYYYDKDYFKTVYPEPEKPESLKDQL